METQNHLNLLRIKMSMMAATLNGGQLLGRISWHYTKVPRISWTKGCNTLQLSRGFLKDKTLLLDASASELNTSLMPCRGGGYVLENSRLHVMSPNISSPNFIVESLDAWDDEYDGVVIDPNSLPSSANAFASALRASLSNWKLKRKKGIWLKILLDQADLVPIAIQEGFKYHHAEPGYVMLTYWIPDEPCMLPASPSHQIGVGGFVINDQKEVLVVKEKCPCSCSGVWKIPTGYINKSEELFTGAVREVREETGVDTIFLKIVAFRHAHLAAFEKSDLLFVCLLKPLAHKITIDEQEIQAAKWMPLDEFIRQPFYEEDKMSKRVIDICAAAHEDHYNGLIANQLVSKLDDGKLSYLYYDGSTIF